MARRKRQRDGARTLEHLARIFRREIAKRRWGQAEFEQLIAESAAAGEPVEPGERETVRRVLAAIERLSSVNLAAIRASEVLLSGLGGAVPIAVASELIAVLHEQAGRAVGDAFSALVASTRRVERRGGASLEKEAVRLGALRPSASDLRASLAAITAVSPRPRGKGTSRTSEFSRALQDVVAAAAFVDRAVGRVVEVVVRGGREAEKSVGRVPLRKLMGFVARCASFAQRVATLRIAAAGDGD